MDSRKILEKLKDRFEKQSDTITAEIVANPKITDGAEDFRWKCGFASALKLVTREINNILTQEDAVL